METNTEKLTEEFFKRRFPYKDIQFEKECGYFGEQMERFKSGCPELHIDGKPLVVWVKMKKEAYIEEESKWTQMKSYHCERTDEDVEVGKIDNKYIVNCKNYYNSPLKSEFSTAYRCFNDFWSNKKCLIERKIK